MLATFSALVSRIHLLITRMKSFRRVVPLALSLLATPSCSTGPAGGNDTLPTRFISSQDTSSGESKVAMVGDSVVFNVWGYPDFTTRTQIRESGTILVPLVGELPVAGYTRDEFSKHLKERLAEFIKGDIRLFLDIFRPLPRITVLGAVSRQGSFPSSSDMTLVEVLSAAGGWTDQSDLRYIKINRQSIQTGEPPSLEVNLELFIESGNIRQLPLVRQGDVVFVPRKENVARDISEFLRDAILFFGAFALFK